ncbi:putative uncharacterized protein [Acidiphilium sp. CAG:727]|nr:putative uncharacterized protein [Acidiphilium sp. CAG:727]
MDIAKIFENFAKSFTDKPFSSCLTIAALFVLFFFAISVLYRNNAKWLIFAFIAFILVTGCIFVTIKDKREIERYLYLLIPALCIVAETGLFATEIKRDIWETFTKKSGEIRHVEKGSPKKNTADACIDEIIKALQNMSKNDVGAIIILANDNLPRAIIESGVVVDSDISSALIESIFFPKTPLHDGAMIINGTKILASGCFLPLSQETNIPKELGTRHRAGIGITETINVTALIVSEETGIISIAQGGKIKRYADSEMLRQTLKEYYWQEFLPHK